MGSKLTLRNNLDNEFTIEHQDGLQNKLIKSNDIAVAVDTIDDFPSVANTGDVVIVRDMNRGGTFVYDATKSAENNGGTVFAGWVRQYSGAVNVKWFGAVGDGVTDDTVAIQMAINYAISLGTSCYIPAGEYIVSSTLDIRATSGFTLYGDNVGDYRVGYSNGTTLKLPEIGISLDNLGAGTDRTNNVTLRNLYLLRSDLSRTGIGVDVPANSSFHGNFKFDNILVSFFDTGLSVDYQGWIFIDGSTFQNNTTGAKIIANIVGISNSRFYQNALGSGIVANNAESAYNSTLPHGLWLSANGCSISATDFEDNCIGLGTYSSTNVNEATVDISGCYFESCTKSHLYSYQGRLSMQGCYSNESGIPFILLASSLRVSSSIKIAIVSITSIVDSDETITAINEYLSLSSSNIPDYTLLPMGKIRTYRGVPNELLVDDYASFGFDRGFVGSAYTVVNATSTYNTTISNSPLERNSNTIDITDNGGYAELRSYGVLNANYTYASTITFKSTTGYLYYSLVEDTTGTVIAGGTIRTIADIDNITTACIVFTGVSSTNTVRLRVSPTFISANVGTSMEILGFTGLSRQQYTKKFDFVSHGNPKVKILTGTPTVGRHEQGTQVLVKYPVTNGHIGWVCTASGVPGTWKTFGTIQA
jgi:hypothetical protein